MHVHGIGRNSVIDEYLATEYRSMTCGSANNNCYGPPCSLSHRRRRVSESLFITTSIDDDEEKRTEQNLAVRSGKSEAEVTNDRRLRSTYCTIEAIYWQTWCIARPLCDSRATCTRTEKNVARRLFIYTEPAESMLWTTTKRYHHPTLNANRLSVCMRRSLSVDWAPIMRCRLIALAIDWSSDLSDTMSIEFLLHDCHWQITQICKLYHCDMIRSREKDPDS